MPKSKKQQQPEEEPVDGILMQDFVTVVHKDSKGRIKKYGSDDMPPIEASSHNAVKNLEIEISSAQQDNEKLLHHLYKKTFRK